MTDITELAQSLKAAANTTADAIDRLKAFPGDELIDLSQHEGEQVDIDITTINAWYELSSPANIRALVGEQPDAMGFRNFASCLIEAKCSRADLLADRKKRFRLRPELGMGDWRFFISEPGIISVEDLPPGWGLLHVVNGKVRKVYGWPQGNCCWGSAEDKPFTGNKQVECDYMLSALRRMELRGHLNEIYDGVIVNRAAEGANQ